MLWYIYCKIKEQWPPVFMFTHPCIHSCARYWSDLILSTPCHPRASCYRNIHVGRRDRGQGSEHSTTLLLGFYPSHICSSFVLLFSSLPVLCQFMMAFVVWDWDSMSHYRISNAYDFPGKLKMCHSLPCITDTVLSNKCNRGCFFLVTITMDSTQECAIWYSSTLIQCPVSLSGQ